MTPKQLLTQLRWLDNRINSEHRQMEYLRSLAEKVTTTYIHAKTHEYKQHDNTATLIAKIVDMQQEIDKKINRLIDLRKEAKAKINALNNPNYQQVISLRYIEGKTWEQIAEIMHYTLRWIYILHGRALQKMAE